MVRVHHNDARQAENLPEMLERHKYWRSVMDLKAEALFYLLHSAQSRLTKAIAEGDDESARIVAASESLVRDLMQREGVEVDAA